MVKPSVTGRVLVVEDDARIANLVGELLGVLDYTVKVALTGEDGLEQVPIFQPDVILLDLTLPGMTGGEVLDRLRQEYPDVPVVVMTGDRESASGTLARGAMAWLGKPFKIEALAKTLGDCLRMQREQ